MRALSLGSRLDDGLGVDVSLLLGSSSSLTTLFTLTLLALFGRLLALGGSSLGNSVEGGGFGLREG